MATSAVLTDREQLRPGMLVSCCAVWYRLTHQVEGRWHGVRLGAMDRATAEQFEQRPGLAVWPIPQPFLW